MLPRMPSRHQGQTLLMILPVTRSLRLSPLPCRGRRSCQIPFPRTLYYAPRPALHPERPVRKMLCVLVASNHNAVYTAHSMNHLRVCVFFLLMLPYQSYLPVKCHPPEPLPFRHPCFEGSHRLQLFHRCELVQ